MAAGSRVAMVAASISRESARRAGTARLQADRSPRTTAETLLALAAENGARAIFWNRRYEPAVIARDREVERYARERGIAAESCPGNLLFEPGTILNNDGKPFRVFTAFWRACLVQPDPAKPTPAPARLPAPAQWPLSMHRRARPRTAIDWAGGLRETWRPGEARAGRASKLSRECLKSYLVDRDRPDHVGTSRLSPHLHFGEISARQIWHECAIQQNRRALSAPNRMARILLSPAIPLPAHAARAAAAGVRRFPWRVDAKSSPAWTQGKTGYPLVDAGMRELWHTGWMHNRVRMVVASFLVKHLMIGWQEGAAWFWDTLVDADLANNTMGWQWSAGCGADAAPYFRIFNPVIQGEKFDPKGDYVRRWVPELADVPARWIHKPWESPEPAAREEIPRAHR